MLQPLGIHNTNGINFLEKHHLPIRGEETCPVITIKGIESNIASATPVIKLLAPGPLVATQRPLALCDVLPALAAKAAACS